MEHQRKVLVDPSRFKVLACGRRWAKTTSGLLAAIDGHGPRRGYWRGALQGGRIWWIAPTVKTASPIWRELKRAAQHGWTAKNEVERRIEFPGGGSVSVKSADEPDSLRGEGLDGAFLDEAAFMAQQTWNEVIRPALADRNGWAIFGSTPNGFNWFEELFRYAGNSEGWARWQRPTSDNPLIPQSELDDARKALGPHRFAQEFEAQFVNVQGAEFPADYFGDHIWFDEWPTNIRIKTMALDPSKGKDAKKGDYSAIVKLAYSTEGLIYVDADMERRPAEKIVEDATAIYRDWQPNAFAIEVNQFQELLVGMFRNRFKQIGMLTDTLTPIENHSKKEVRIRTLGPLFEQRRVRMFRNSPGAQMLLNQFREFPMGQHDDGPDAMEMAARLAGNLIANPGSDNFGSKLVDTD